MSNARDDEPQASLGAQEPSRTSIDSVGQATNTTRDEQPQAALGAQEPSHSDIESIGHPPIRQSGAPARLPMPIDRREETIETEPRYVQAARTQQERFERDMRERDARFNDRMALPLDKYDEDVFRLFMESVPDVNAAIGAPDDWNWRRDFKLVFPEPGNLVHEQVGSSKLSITDFTEKGRILYRGADIALHLNTVGLKEAPHVRGDRQFWDLMWRFDRREHPPEDKVQDDDQDETQNSNDSEDDLNDQASHSGGSRRETPLPYGRYIQAMPSSSLCHAMLELRSSIDRLLGIGFFPNLGPDSARHAGVQSLFCDRFHDGSSRFGAEGIVQTFNVSCLSCLNPKKNHIIREAHSPDTELKPWSPIGTVMHRFRVSLSLNLYGLPMHQPYTNPLRPWKILRVTDSNCHNTSMSGYKMETVPGNIQISPKQYDWGIHAFLCEIIEVSRQLQKEMMYTIKRIRKDVSSGDEAIFSYQKQQMLLFDDRRDFPTSKRYLLSQHTLDMIRQDVDVLTELIESNASPRASFYKRYLGWRWETLANGIARVSEEWAKRLDDFDRELEVVLKELRQVTAAADKLHKDISGLFDTVYVMTSLNENRQSKKAAQASIELAKTANLQNRSIKLFTIFTVFFLPLGYVTSVFGMNNMPMDGPFYPFAYTTIAICLPTYILMGLLWPTNPIKTWREYLGKGQSTQTHSENVSIQNQEFLEPPDTPDSMPGLKHRILSENTRLFGSMFMRTEEPQSQTNRPVSVAVDASTEV